MTAWRGLLATIVVAMCACNGYAQSAPVLGNIEASYANLQSSVKIAGTQWGPGAVAYGPVGTPLVLTGTNLSSSGTIKFVPYKNGVVDSSATAAVATVTLWSANTLMFTVPSGALSGLVTVTTVGGTSNGLPFLVTPGTYSTSCPSPFAQVKPTIAWPTPTAITYGTALSATQLDAAASVPGTSVAGTYTPVAGTFSYSPASGTVLAAGNQTLNATFTPNNTAAFTSASAAIVLTVNQATPVITWPTPANVFPATALSSTQLNATASVPGTFAYSPTAGTIVAVGSHTLSLTFTPTDTTDYSTITATVTLTASLAPSAGIITTVAGNGTEGYLGDGGLAIAAELYDSSEATLDALGNLYFYDYFNYRIRMVSSTTGIITTVAGNGVDGYSGDGGPATSAKIGICLGLAVDVSGNIYINDFYNLRIRKVSALTGNISTVAGNGVAGYSGVGGSAINAEIYPEGLAVDSSGNLYFGNDSPGTSVMEKVTAATGIISAIPGLSAGLPVVDAAGNLYLTSAGYIKKVSSTTGATISVIAGNGTLGHTGDGGPATSAEIDPGGLMIDSGSNLYFWDLDDNAVRKVTTSSGTISVDALVGGGNGCSQETDNVGDGCPSTDGIISAIYGSAADINGNIFLADHFNNRVRAVGALTVPAVSVSCSPNPITFGGPNSQCTVTVGSGATGTVTLTYNGTTWATVTLSAGTATATWPSTTGGGAFSIVATYTGDAIHSPAVGSTSLVVTQLTPTIVWPSPTPILYGTQLSATQLNAVANVPGSYIYSPALGATPAVGVDTLMVTFTPQSSGYSTITATTPLIVNSVVTTLPTITSILPDPAAVKPIIHFQFILPNSSWPQSVNEKSDSVFTVDCVVHALYFDHRWRSLSC